LCSTSTITGTTTITTGITTGRGIEIAIAGATIGGSTIAKHARIFVTGATHAAALMKIVWSFAARDGTARATDQQTARSCAEIGEGIGQRFAATGGAMARFAEDVAMIARLRVATGGAIARFAEDVAMMARLFAAIAEAIGRCVVDAAEISRACSATGARIVFGCNAIARRSGATGV